MSERLRQIARGGIAGLVGTLAMSGVIVIGRAAQWYWLMPPKEIAGRAENKVGIRQGLTSTEFKVTWVAAHLGYGAAGGAAYSLLRGFLPRVTTAAGLLFGGLVWAVSYLGIMPALGVYPWPRDDSRTRLVTMILAHGVYGVTTAIGDRLLSRRVHL